MAPASAPFIIAISGPSGGGKSTLLEAVGARLGDAITLEHDHYLDRDSIPENLADWMRAGADFNAWQLPRFVADLSALSEGQAATKGRRPVGPARFVICAAPLSRAHRATGRFFDLTVHVDTPLEIALARCFNREFERFARKPGTVPPEKHLALHRDFVQHLKNLAQGYLTAGGPIHREQRRQVLPLADLVLNGELGPIELTEAIVAEVHARVEQLPCSLTS